MNDRLTQLFQLQADLQAKAYGIPLTELSPGDRGNYVMTMHTAIIKELGEALDEVSWKPWASAQFLNRDAYVGELVDVLHLFMNLVLATSEDPAMLADEIFTRYCAKNAVNAQRQEDGYDGVSGKCRKCSRALDDSATHCTLDINGNGYCHEFKLIYHVARPTEVVFTPLASTQPGKLCTSCGRSLADPKVDCWQRDDHAWCATKNIDVNLV